MSELKLDELIGTINQESEKIESKNQRIINQLENFQKQKVPQFQQGDKILNKKIQRETNYKIVSEDVSKYQPIVKKHREANQIDFRQQKDIANLNFNNKITLQNKKQEYAPLSKRSLLTQEEYEKRMQSQLEKAKDKQAIQEEMSKQKHLIFYKELKQKRLKKIKSKLYRRIKKRNLKKKEEADFQQRILSDKQFAMDELEKMEKRRAEERSQMRHKNKSDYTRLLRKYAGEQAAQQAYKNLNAYRQDIKNKLQEIVEKVDEDSESDYDEYDYKNEAIQELDELIQDNNIDSEPQNMIDKIIKQQNLQIIDEGKQIRDKLYNEEWDEIQDEQSNTEKQQNLKADGKKIYNNEGILDNRVQRKEKKQIVNMSDLLNVHSIENQLNIKKQNKKQPTKQNSSLLSGINLDKIKNRYKEQQNKISLQGTKILEEQNQKFQQFEVESDQEFYNDFQKEKYQNIEEEAEDNKKVQEMKGWGSWTGFGVKQSQRELQREKQQQIERLKKIEKIKQNRKDRNNDRVIINEKRPKILKKYLIQQLPHGQGNRQQFNYKISRPLGSEWNTEEIYRNNTKQNVINYAGDEIKPLDKKNLPKTKFIQLMCIQIIYQPLYISLINLFEISQEHQVSFVLNYSSQFSFILKNYLFYIQ